jgi:hypothetical protein
MPTKKPLIDLVPELLIHFEKYREQLQFDLRLYKLHEGQVRQEVEKSLASEMVSNAAYRRAVQRIPSLNITKKVVDKSSQVYKEPVQRFAGVSDLETLQKFEKSSGVDYTMLNANRVLNMHKRAAIELYVDNGTQKSRVLAGHQFLVWSDDKINPLNPTVFMKLLGKDHIVRTQVTDRDGNRITNEDDIVEVDLIALYSDNEFLIIDSSGHVRSDKMSEMGITSSVNPYGIIPFVYINLSPFDLIPYPNKTALDIAVLIPKLLTDLNYSAQFLSHSVIWTTNSDLSGAEINPDAIVNLGSTDTTTGNTPAIGTIDPKTDIDGVLKLIEFQLASYMSTLGLKTGSIGELTAGNAASGVSKILDEADATEVRKAQIELFKKAEYQYWEKFSQMQEIWSQMEGVKDKELFSDKFIKEFSLRFADIRPLESDSEKYNRIKVARDIKLITKKQALKELYPTLSEDQIDQRIKELEDEGKKEKEDMMSMGLTPSFTQLASQQSNEPLNNDKTNSNSDNIQ